MKTAILLISLPVFNMALAQQSEFEKFKQEYLQQQANFHKQQNAEFEAYKHKFRQELEAYKRKIKTKWQIAEVNTANKLVVYSEDLTQKVVINYKRNEIRVSVLDSKQPKAKIEDQLKATLNTPLEQLIKQSKRELKDKPILTRDGLTLAESLGVEKPQVKQFVQKISQNNAIVVEQQIIQERITELEKTTEEIQAGTQENQVQDRDYLAILKKEKAEYKQLLKANLTKKNTHTRKIDLSSSRWDKAKPYHVDVRRQSKTYQLPLPLLYAIMETESNFNPLAETVIMPAFGLMQIIPDSMGAEVNRFLNNKGTPPTSTQLFEPKTNILYGSTYLNMLFNQYLKSIESGESRLYCVIAAYNAGAGGLARSFNGGFDKNLKKAIKKINTMPSDQVLKHLTNSLSYGESKKYLLDVIEAISFFEKHITGS